MMRRMEHLSDSEMLDFLEGYLDDRYMRSHVENCASCRSSLSDTLVLIRALGNGSTHGALDELRVSRSRAQAMRRSARGFAPIQREQRGHLDQGQLNRFFEASHHWKTPGRDYFDVALHLMECDTCLSQFIDLSKELAPDPETMKKVMNMAATLAMSAGKTTPKTLAEPIDVIANLIDKLRIKARDALEFADRWSGGAAYSARPVRYSVSPHLHDKAMFSSLLEDAEFSEESLPAMAREAFDDRITLNTDARNQRGQWLVTLRISGGALGPHAGPLFYELVDADGLALNSGEFPKTGELEVPADIPVAEVKISGKRISETFGIRFPSTQELELIAHVERAIRRLREAQEAETKLREQLQGVRDHRRNAQEQLSHLLTELDRLRHQQG